MNGRPNVVEERENVQRVDRPVGKRAAEPRQRRDGFGGRGNRSSADPGSVGASPCGGGLEECVHRPTVAGRNSRPVLDRARIADTWGMFRLRNGVQPYAWGSRTAIADLLGVEPSGGPQAELWIGAHPALPSEADRPVAKGGRPSLKDGTRSVRFGIGVRFPACATAHVGSELPLGAVPRGNLPVMK